MVASQKPTIPSRVRTTNVCHAFSAVVLPFLLFFHALFGLPVLRAPRGEGTANVITYHTYRNIIQCIGRYEYGWIHLFLLPADVVVSQTGLTARNLLLLHYCTTRTVLIVVLFFTTLPLKNLGKKNARPSFSFRVVTSSIHAASSLLKSAVSKRRRVRPQENEKGCGQSSLISL